jgi:hypothetical protein
MPGAAWYPGPSNGAFPLRIDRTLGTSTGPSQYLSERSLRHDRGDSGGEHRRLVETGYTSNLWSARLRALKKLCGSTSTSSLRLPLVFGPAASHSRKYSEIDIAQRFHQQAEPVAALDDRKRRFGGPSTWMRRRSGRWRRAFAQNFRSGRSPAEIIRLASRRTADSRRAPRLDLAGVERPRSLATTPSSRDVRAVGLQIADAAAPRARRGRSPG